MDKKVRCRMAPSPTGLLHLGTAHTALFNYLFARHYGGTFILRIDDTDQARNQPGSEENIIKGLKWLGIEWDEGPDIGGPNAPYRQSERLEIYKPYIRKLLDQGSAYYCYCTPEELEEERKAQQEGGIVPKYSGKCSKLTLNKKRKLESEGRKPAIRFRNPGELVKFTDMVRGEIEVEMGQFGDFVIVRSNGYPLLNFAVLVDDIEMKITHAIRGEDFLNATPYQVLVYEALGVKPPKIANLSFLYGPDHQKLSKRHGATAISEFRDLGYLPEAMVNFLALLGWNPGDEREIFSKDQLIKEFDFDKVQKGAPVVNTNKLNWFNSYYIRKKTDSELAKLFKPFVPEKVSEQLLLRISPLVKERIEKLSDIKTLASFFWEQPRLDQKQFTSTDALSHIGQAHEALELLSDWKVETINQALQLIPGHNSWKTGDFFMSLRIAVTGSKVTPPLSESLEVLGKEDTLVRLRDASSGLKI